VSAWPAAAGRPGRHPTGGSARAGCVARPAPAQRVGRNRCHPRQVALSSHRGSVTRRHKAVRADRAAPTLLAAGCGLDDARAA